MKFFLCFINLVGLCSVQATGDNYWFGDRHGHIVNSGHHDYNQIEKPCPFLDVKCVQEFLKYRFGCSPVYGNAPEPNYEKLLPLDLANGNVTAEVRDVQLYGLSSGKVNTFFINEETDTMVLEVAFDSVLLKSPRALITYYRKGKEPIKVEDYVEYEFRDFSLTWIYEGVRERKQSKSYVFAYMYDKNPKFKVSPIFQSTNGHQNGWISNANLSIREAMVNQGAMFMTAYLKSNVCGLQL